MIFKVTIREDMYGEFYVKADNIYEAEEKVLDAYYCEEITCDQFGGYVDHDTCVIPENDYSLPEDNNNNQSGIYGYVINNTSFKGVDNK